MSLSTKIINLLITKEVVTQILSRCQLLLLRSIKQTQILPLKGGDMIVFWHYRCGKPINIAALPTT